MPGDFHLLDLISQAPAVRRRLAGLPEAEKLAWLATRGSLEPLAEIGDRFGGRPLHLFESRLGFRCIFFLKGDEFVFVGEDATFTVRDADDPRPRPPRPAAPGLAAALLRRFGRFRQAGRRSPEA